MEEAYVMPVITYAQGLFRERFAPLRSVTSLTLSQRNVIPKYGFPVDVVELQITHHGEEAKGWS